MKRPLIIPPVYFAGSIALMLALCRYFPGKQVLPTPWNWSGVALMAVAAAFAVSAVRLFKKYQTAMRPGEAPRALIKEGPYRISRNPIYLSLALFIVGLALVLNQLTPWLALPVFILAISLDVIPVEEAMLHKAFGEEYLRYQKTIRRWV